MVAQFTLGIVAILLFVAARALEKSGRPVALARALQILAVFLIGAMLWPVVADLWGAGS
jgi:cytochrome bd-type quinol oxidase subunit 2